MKLLPEFAESYSSRGLLETVSSTGSALSSNFTFEELERVIREMMERDKRRKHRIDLPAYGYDEMSDEEFKDFIGYMKALDGDFYEVTFMGGYKGYTAFKERLAQLSIALY